MFSTRVGPGKEVLNGGDGVNTEVIIEGGDGVRRAHLSGTLDGFPSAR